MSFEPLSIGNQRTLKVAHAAFSTLHAAAKCLKSIGRQTVNAPRDILKMVSVCIEKARHIHVGIRSHIERTFVVNIIGHAHHTVIACHQLLPKNIDIVAKFILTKHSVDGGQHERCARHRLAQSIKAMH